MKTPLTESEKEIRSIRNYYVDEAGDGTLFNRRGKVILDKEGCSRFFILGLLDIPDPDSLEKDLEKLRKNLITDPYFKGVPSMQPKSMKTALAFHAKDDLPEVRREVFSILMKHDLQFFGVIRDKIKVLEYVRQRNEGDPSYRYNPNELYDYLVRRLFKDRLHKDDGYRIYFSERGKSDRTEALLKALEKARKSFSEKWGIQSTAPIEVVPNRPKTCLSLQAVDYFLWALQRFYERKEERYLRFIWSSVRLVHDIDDTRQDQYGVYYTQKKPLTLAALT
jgi:hypothetical protein